MRYTYRCDTLYTGRMSKVFFSSKNDFAESRGINYNHIENFIQTYIYVCILWKI